MERIIKKDYPFTVIIEDKIGKTSGKMYQSISLGHTSIKNKEATNPQDKYQTNWFGFFDEKDLLKLANLVNSAYNTLKEQRGKSSAPVQMIPPVKVIPLATKQVQQELPQPLEFEDDVVPF
jgi:hypothetical protein